MIEIAVLTNIRRTATIQAKTYCNIYSLEQHDLFEVLKNYPKIKSKLMNVAGERLQALSKKRVVENCAHLFTNETMYVYNNILGIILMLSILRVTN